MKRSLRFLPLVFMLSCSTTHYYVVRHAEKAAADNMMTSDVPLSEAGQQRAVALKDALGRKNIQHIYSTNFIRTKATAQPLSTAISIPVETYNPADSTFTNKLKTINGNVLVVGHSNTVDNIVNGLTGQNLLQDLPDSQYGDLFIINKKGTRYRFKQGHFGQ